MDIVQLFVLSEHALTKIVDQIGNDQWQLPVPKAIQKDEISLAKLINYHAYDDAWVPDVLAGKTKEEVGTQFDGDLLGNDPKKSWHTIVDLAVAAANQLTPQDIDKITHLSYGDYVVKEYLFHITLFRTFRTVDLARFLKLDDSLPEKLVQGMWELLVPQAIMLRQVGVFGPEIVVNKSAPLQERLLGLSGRQPK